MPENENQNEELNESVSLNSGLNVEESSGLAEDGMIDRSEQQIEMQALNEAIDPDKARADALRAAHEKYKKKEATQMTHKDLPPMSAGLFVSKPEENPSAKSQKKVGLLQSTYNAIETGMSTYSDVNENIVDSGVASKENWENTMETDELNEDLDLIPPVFTIVDAYTKGKALLDGKPNKRTYVDNIIPVLKGITESTEYVVNLVGKGSEATEAAFGGVTTGLTVVKNFRNAVTRYQSLQKMKELEESHFEVQEALEDSEKETIAAYTKRMSNKMYLDISEFVLNSVDLITSFFPAASAVVKPLKMASFAFKTAYQQYHNFQSNKEIRRSGRVTGEGNDLDTEDFIELENILKGNDPSGDAKIHVLVIAYNNLRLLEESDEESEANEIEKNRLKDYLDTFIDEYNDAYDTNITIRHIGNLEKSYQKTIRSIIKQVDKEQGRFDKFKRFFHKEHKILAVKELRELYVKKGKDVAPDQINLKDLIKGDKQTKPLYFWEKTKVAISTTVTRKYLKDKELEKNLAIVLKKKPAKFLSKLQKAAKKFEEVDLDEAGGKEKYNQTVDEFIAKLEL